MSDLMEDLDAFVVGDPEDEPDEPPPVPEDAEGANRLLRRIRGYERLLERHRAIAFAELGRIQEWYEDRASGIQGSIRFAERSLEQWMRDHHAATGGKVKTVKVPNGELRVRPGSSRIGVLDEDAAIAEVVALERFSWVRTKEEIAKSKAGDWLVAGPTVVAGPARDPAPEGSEWREAWTVSGFDPAWLVAVPRLVRVENLAVLVALRPSFSYGTAKAAKEDGK